MCLFLSKIEILEIEKPNTIDISEFIPSSKLLVNIHITKLKV